MNAVIIAIIVMVVLSLTRVSVVFSLIIAAIVGGLIGGLSINETLKVFTDGLGDGATIALSYAVLGAFAVALSRSGLAESMAQAAIRKLTGNSASNNKPTEKNTKLVTYMLLGVLAIAAVSSQNLIPVHIAFIPILVPPLLSLMNTLKLDRRLAACVLTFGLVATYMFLPVGFGSIFLYDLLLKNLNNAGESVGLVIDHSIVVKSMAIPFLGMVFGLLVALFYSYRKPREYNLSVTPQKKSDEQSNLIQESNSQSDYSVTDSQKKFKKLQSWQIGMLVIALIGTVVLQLFYDSMILGGLFGFAVLSVTGVFRWQEQDSVFVEGMRMMALVGFIMISAAGFATVMKATGHVDTLVQTSMSYIGDNKGLASFVMLLVGLFITMGIGSSFSTIPIITVIFVPIAFHLGFSPAAIVAIVGTAAALGDAGSPASDSTLGPTSGLNADGQHDHIWDSVVPTFLHYNLPLLVFGWVASMIL